MSDGFTAIAALIREGGRQGFRQLHEELFTEAELPAFRLLREHYLHHGELPPFEAFQRAGINLPATTHVPGMDSSFGYALEQLRGRARFSAFTEASTGLHSALTARDLVQAGEAVRHLNARLGTLGVQEGSATGADIMQSLLEDYWDTLAMLEHGGDLGIPSGWPTLDRLTNGWLGGDLVVFVGRRGAGKSYVMCRMVNQALVRRCRVVFVTMEMTAKQIMRRMAALQLRLDPNQLVRGELSEEDQRRFETTVENYDQYPLHMVQGNFDRNVDDVAAEARTYRPDIVFVDGSYLLRPSEHGLKARWEKVASVHQSLKTGLAMAADIPVVCSVQQNRASKGRKDGDGITADSDQIEQLASIMVQIKKHRESARRILDVVKNRDGEEGKFVINYVFSRLNLDQNEDDTRREHERQAHEAAQAAQANEML